jgi:hypothetical protein
MNKNRADTRKNRLYVNFIERMDVEEVKVSGADVIQEAKKIKPGFGIISDISEFSPTTEEGRLGMQNVMKTLKEMGVSHLARIVKHHNSLSSYQWQRTSKAVGYAADEVPTMAEAEIMLDKLENK